MDFRAPSEAVMKTARAAVGNRLVRERLEKAEGEGFEPSIRLTTDNGFRDRFEYADLQAFCRRAPGLCASQQPSVHEAGRQAPAVSALARFTRQPRFVTRPDVTRDRQRELG